MEKTESAVRSRLLEAGKEEFREKGFLKASLRAICKKAEVTTGALYFFFESKSALFEEIVEETMENLEQIIKKLTDQEDQLKPEEYDRILMEFIWENRDIARILIDGAEGTRYENFRDDTCEKMEQLLQENFRQKCGKEADDDLVHILVKMKLQGYCELLRGDHSREKILEVSRMLKLCTDQSIKAIEVEMNKNR